MDGIFMILSFSDRFSYKILCIPTNGLRDMIFARFAKRKGNRQGMDLRCPGPDLA
jgi:hypothetical protein